MLSLPDFKQKQLLFIQAERGVKTRIKFQNENIVYTKDGEIVNRVSCHKVFAVFVVGDLSITTQLMKNAVEHGVSFFFLKPNFQVYASVNAASEANYLLKQQQYTMANERELDLSKQLVRVKIQNQAILLKTIKDVEKSARLKDFVAAISLARDHASLRGIEGSASKVFFGSYFKDIGWLRRMPRVKPDIPNFLLDSGYTILFNCVDSLLRLYGFDVYKGCYHQLFFQRKSLTCDIVEPFRCIIDRQLRKSFNLGQIDEKDFKVKDNRVSAVDFEKSSKYSKLFMSAVMDNKEPLYNFVQGFYRHVMNPEKNPFPEFKIR